MNGFHWFSWEQSPIAQRPPSLRSLAAFEAAARHRSFAKAAGELNLTAGAVSHAIRSLEIRLGGPLFERVGRGVVLTPSGQAFAARVRLGLSLITDAFGSGVRSRSNRLVVSTLPSIAAKILLPGLQQLRTIVPDIALEVRLTEELETFDDSDVDLAIRFGPGEWPGLFSQRLATERLFPVCSPAFLAQHKPSRPEDLISCPLIGHPSSSWKLWLDPLGLDFNAHRPWLTIGDAAVAIDAASLGHGIALARANLARGDLAAGRIVRLFEHEVSAEYEYSCVSRPSGPKGSLAVAFVEWLSREMGAGVLAAA